MTTQGIQGSTPPLAAGHTVYDIQQHYPYQLMGMSMPHTSPQMDLMNMMSEMNKKLSKLDQLDAIENKLVTLESQVKELRELNTVVTDLQTSMTFVSDEVNDIKKELKSVTMDSKELKKQNEKLIQLNTKMTTDILDVKTRSMRDNLIFFGIKESEDENCEEKLKVMIKDKQSTKKTVSPPRKVT